MTTPRYTTLIDVDALRELMRERAPLVVLDASFDLADAAAGERQFLEAHIPGAQYVHLERDLSGPKTGRNGRHPLPSREAFGRTAGALGITPQTQVVVYDRQGATYAGRAWWMLRWIGHGPVAVLDGGFAAWHAAGGESAGGAQARSGAAAYPLQAATMRSVDVEQLQRSLGSIRLVDARAAERYRGEVEPLDARAGHIPGALNRFFQHNLASDGRLKPAQELRREFTALLGAGTGADVVHQCGSGVSACHNLLAMEVAGLTGSALYPGSWSEWSSDPARPAAVG
jgi:thiosulfate/3-mercaptopyruvate sulfurtransferase